MEKRKTLLHDALCTLLLLGGAVAVCSVLSRVHDDNNPFAVLIFVLAVAIVALVTTGYVWGVVASVIGVFCVNYMFAYPFWSFDMSISGYPLTFMVMLVVSVVISTLTTRLKQTERLRYEVESEKGGVAVFSEIYYPGWTVTIDGKETEFGRVNYVLRALKVPAGKHVVTAEFRPRSITVTTGIAYGAIVLIFLLLGLVVYKKTT